MREDALENRHHGFGKTIAIMDAVFDRILLEQALGVSWDNYWSYPYGGQIHQVALSTWPLHFAVQPVAAAGSFVSKLSASLADYPDGSREYFLEQRYLSRSMHYRFRTIPIGWGQTGQRRYAGGKEEAERAHQGLVYYLDHFMLARRLFNDIFEEMCAGRRAFLAHLG